MFCVPIKCCEQNVSNYCGVKSIQYWRKVFDEHSKEEEERKKNSEKKNGLNLVSFGAQLRARAQSAQHTHRAHNVPILLCLAVFSYKFWARSCRWSWWVASLFYTIGFRCAFFSSASLLSSSLHFISGGALISFRFIFLRRCWVIR